ncbi:pectate lyase [Hallella bergensis]|uniref:pectate lyase family protein n=1 Tax=Hallella bergensis TaxID=242750 RepID=UPI003990C928
MKHSYILAAVLLFAQTAVAQNKVNLMLNSGQVETYETGTLKSIDFDKAKVTVNPAVGDATVYDGKVNTISFQKQNAIRRAQGWQESAYVEWDLMEGATYNVYIQGGDYADWTAIDAPLVRLYDAYGRADVVGLRAGYYRLRVVPVVDGKERTDRTSETGLLRVVNYDRSGFAHKDYQGVGAYNDDGTLKSGAKVIYVDAQNAKTVTAKLSSGTFIGLQGIIKAYEKGNVSEPLAIRIKGLISAADVDYFGSSAEGIQMKGRRADSELNITIEGIGEDATIKGFGFLVRNAKSVEIRNLGIMRQMDDGISLDTDNSNIWIHNIDVFYGKSGSGDHAKGDGAIDVKSNSKFVTISYCHFWDTGKSSMAGMKSESGPNYITYHHNWFDHSDSRHARVRTMSVHLYNNYFDGVSKYGIGATSGSSIFAENNYFRATNKPLLSSLQGTDAKGTGTFSGENGGIIKAYGNIFAETSNSSYYKPITWSSNHSSFDCYEVPMREDQVPAAVVTLKGGTTYNNFDTNASLMYAYTPDEAADVPGKVTGYYGAGRLNHGDLQFAFNNSVDDRDYGVNKSLAALLDSYVGAGATSGGNSGDEGGTGKEPGGEDPSAGGETPVEGAVVCSFDKAGTPSSSLFTVAGNGSNSKGTATYNGKTYNTCLKMESTTNISFTTTKPMKLTLVFADTETASFKLDGKKTVGTSSTYTFDSLPAGEHTITKQDTRNLFLIVIEP